jgi:hypothetical protein
VTRSPIKRLMNVLLCGETVLLRFFFSLAGFGWVSWVLVDVSFAEFHEHAMKLATPNQFAMIFFIHSCALLYGVVTQKYNRWLLMLEGALGVFAWSAMAWAETMDQTGIGPSAVGALVAFFLLVRYPTHYTPKDEIHGD